MAHEVTAWKKDGCSLSVKVAAVTTRAPFSQEINERDGTGGWLKADYQQVEAVAIIANALGQANLVYGFNFVFKTVGENVVVDFSDELAKALGERVLAILGFQ